MSAKLLDGKAFAAQMKREIAEEVRVLREKGIHPKLAVCVVGDDPASKIYVAHKRKACEEVGIASLCNFLPKDVKTDALQALISDWNHDDSIHGILVQLPLPMDQFPVLDVISPNKDVDGFNPSNLGRTMHGRPLFLPCTPSAVCFLLDQAGIDLRGKKVVVINDTIVVGRPLAMMLLERRATVTFCHNDSGEDKVEEYTKKADIIITAVGKRPRFKLTAEMVPQGAVVIDVGISRLPDNTIAGDAEKDVVEKASYLTPVPNGVGPLTVSFLLRNTVLAARRST